MACEGQGAACVSKYGRSPMLTSGLNPNYSRRFCVSAWACQSISSPCIWSWFWFKRTEAFHV